MSTCPGTARHGEARRGRAGLGVAGLWLGVARQGRLDGRRAGSTPARGARSRSTSGCVAARLGEASSCGAGMGWAGHVEEARQVALRPGAAWLSTAQRGRAWRGMARALAARMVGGRVRFPARALAARHGRAWKGTDGRGQARRGREGVRTVAPEVRLLRRTRTGHGRTWQAVARPAAARQCLAGHGMENGERVAHTGVRVPGAHARPGAAGPGMARRGSAWPGVAWLGRDFTHHGGTRASSPMTKEPRWTFALS